jgi:hypothetical protein
MAYIPLCLVLIANFVVYALVEVWLDLR